MKRYISGKPLGFAFAFCLTSYLAPMQAFAAKAEGSLKCEVLPPIIQGFIHHHYSIKKLDPEIETRTIDQFITRLDPSKAYLLLSDVNQIKSSMKGVFKQIGVNNNMSRLSNDNNLIRLLSNCKMIDAAHEVIVKRVEETVAYAKQTLQDPNFKFNENVEITSDAKKRNWSADQSAAKINTNKLINFQLSNYLATDIKLVDAKKKLEHRYELNVKRQKELTKDDLYGQFLDAFATSLDAHSGYLGKDVFEDFEIQMRLSLEGIGAALNWDDGFTVIENLIPGGSAEKSAELQPKDKIIAVAQGEGAFENVIDMPLRDVVRLIRGKKGTAVRLSILRPSSKETSRFIVTLKRDKINLQDEAAKLVYTTIKNGAKSLKIAVIDLPSFYGDMSKGTRSCYEDTKKLVLLAAKEKADGIILDLSKNGGGLLSEAVRIGGLFIKEGNIVATQDSQGRIEQLADENNATEWNGPLIILTSRLSASASEIVAGALKDYQRALIIGSDHTFGKGTVQAMMNLSRELGAIKVTTGMFFVPGGASTQYKGVEADVVLPNIYATKDIGESSLDYSLQPKSLDAFLSQANVNNNGKTWVPVNRSLIEKLKGLSAARVEKDADFKKIKTDLAEIESDNGVISLAKSLKKQKEENAKDKDTKDKRLSKKSKRKTDAEYLKTPEIKEAVQVMIDMLHLTAGSGGGKNESKTAAN